MKKTIKVTLVKRFCPLQEFDDRDFPDEFETVHITFNHQFINYKSRMIKAMLKEAQSRAKVGLACIATLDDDYEGSCYMDIGQVALHSHSKIIY